MRKFIAVLLALVLALSLCACSQKEEKAVERDCGVYIAMEAKDVYALSCGWEGGSESAQAAHEGDPLDASQSYHFDFVGEAAENTEKTLIDYTICLYDKELNIIADASFRDDFSNMAKINITVTADHRILNENSLSCGGDIIVMSDETVMQESAKYMNAKVQILSREEAAAAINARLGEINAEFVGSEYEQLLNTYSNNVEGAEEGTETSPFSMSRTLRVEKADSALLSMRMVDRANLGTSNSLRVWGISFNSQTGEELKLTDITHDTEGFAARCAEEILISTTDSEDYMAGTITFSEGYTDTIKTLITDGHWYLNDEGIVFIANPGEIADPAKGHFEFTVFYKDISDYLNDDYLPKQLEGDTGDVKVSFAEDISTDGLTVVGAENGNIAAAVSGNIYEVSATTVKYNAQSGKITPVTQLFYCSDLSEGGVISVNAELTEAPNLMIEFTRPDGSIEQRLISKSADGKISVLDPDGGETGSDITGRLPYSIDLDGDNKPEKLSLDTNDKKQAVLTLTSGDYSATQATVLVDDVSVRLFDIDGDGNREIYICGSSDGKSMVYVCEYNGTLRPVKFGSADYAAGKLKEFSEGKLVVKNEVSILGKYTVLERYTYNAGAFSKEAGELVFESAPFVTTAKQITLSDGSLLPAGTKLCFTSSDGSSVINYVTEQGMQGSIGIAKADSGWTIAGAPDKDYFESLPY